MQATRGTSIAGGSSAGRAERSRFRWLFASVAVAGLAADVLSKILVVSHLDPETPIRLLGGALTLRLIRNSGAAFSLGESFTVVFAVLSAAVLVFVVARLAPLLGHTGWAVALGLLCAGVSGNLSDRIFRAPGFLRGHVVDFLQLPRWPIFNVADMCITSAAVLIMVLSVFRNVGINGERYQKPTPRTPRPSDIAVSAPEPRTPDSDGPGVHGPEAQRPEARDPENRETQNRENPNRETPAP